MNTPQYTITRYGRKMLQELPLILRLDHDKEVSWLLILCLFCEGGEKRANGYYIRRRRVLELS